jgi:DNA-binding NtrC family response regulator
VARDNPSVGLVFLWPEDSEPIKSGLIETVSILGGIRWIAAAGRDLVARDAFLAFCAECLFDYLSLPLETERLLVILGHAHGMTQVDDRYARLQGQGKAGRFGMIGSSPAMLSLYEQIERAAATDAPVVIGGETGTGKETVARAIHAHSSFSGGPFVALNCVAFSSDPIDAALHADWRRVIGTGLIDSQQPTTAPQDGTLFLEDIEKLPLAAQASLLRGLDRGLETYPVSSASGPFAMRLVCATTDDLESRVREQRFRSDLYYRLRVLSLRVPSLRERGADTGALATHFLAGFRQRNEVRARGIGRAAMDAIALYDWPGNLNELRARVEQAALCSKHRTVTPADLGLEHLVCDRSVVSLQQARDAAERQAIADAIKRSGNNLTRAAEDLRVSRMTLYRLLEKHALRDLITRG